MTTTETRPISDLYKGMGKASLKRIEKGKQLEQMVLTLVKQLGREITDEEMEIFDEIDDQATQNIDQPGIYMWAFEQYVKALGGEVIVKLDNQTFSLDMFDESVFRASVSI